MSEPALDPRPSNHFVTNRIRPQPGTVWQHLLKTPSASLPLHPSTSAVQLQRFLEGNRLGQYTQKLLDNGFDSMEALQSLSGTRMSQLGMRTAHQIQLQKAIAAYSQAKHEQKPPGSTFLGPKPTAIPAAQAPGRAHASGPVAGRRASPSREQPPPASSRSHSSGKGIRDSAQASAGDSTDTSNGLPSPRSVGPTWSWQDGTGQWHPFPAPEVARIQQALDEGKMKTVVTMEGREFFADLEAMQQVAFDSHPLLALHANCPCSFAGF